MSVNGNSRRRNGASLFHQSPARLRQALYKLFSTLFLYPDEERLDILRKSGVMLQQEATVWETYTFSEPLRILLEAMQHLLVGIRLETEVDYTRLFSVRAAAPPYESAYVDPQRQAAGWTAVRLEQEYRQAGLQLAAGLAEQPDHIAVELEFMAFLCGQEAAVWEAQTTEAVMQARLRQYMFLERHVANWFDRFVDRVSAANPTRLYHLVVQAADAFVRDELSTLPKTLESRG